MEHNSLDVVWILLCTVMVIIMQPGFTFFETGLTRAKNSISVALKNIADFFVGGILFGLVGFGLMFGDSLGGFVGGSGFCFRCGPSPWQQAFMMFQLSFCVTAITIISGAVAERMRFVGYLIVSAITAILVYPIVGHWIWAGINDNVDSGWLESLGFMDFAGATVVHSVGGAAALAAIIIIGPRLGRFDRGPSDAFSGHNLTYTTAGTFLLFMGWLGFNGGSLLAVNDLLPLIFLNTFVAGASGGIAAGIAVYIVSGTPRVVHFVTGLLAGLVAITASCDSVSIFSAAVIAAIASWISLAGAYLLEKLEIDDPVNAVPVHLFAGVWGTLAVAIFSKPEALAAGQGRLHQFLIQSIGVVSVVSYSFCVIFALLWLINKVFRFRPSVEIERMGLNLGEHGSKSAINELVTQMQAQYLTNDFSGRIEVDPYSDAGELGSEYNRMLDAVGLENETHRAVEQKLRQFARTDGLTKVANRQFFDDTLELEWQRAYRGKCFISLVVADIDHFKEYNDCFGHPAGDTCLIRVSRAIAASAHRPSDFVARYGGEEFVVLLPDTKHGGAIMVAERMRAAVLSLQLPRSINESDGYVTISCGLSIVLPTANISAKNLLASADSALYDAKRAGRNCIKVTNLSAELLP